MRNRDKFNLQFEEHLADEVLVRYLDGEIPPKESSHTRHHLEACWTCRARAEAMEGAIVRFIEYRDSVYVPAAENPPRGWRTFSSGLARQAAEPVVRDAMPRWFRRMLRPATAYAGLAAAMLVAFVLISRPKVQVVSANEFLVRSAISEHKRTESVARPVVHKRVRVFCRGEAAEWETWNAPSERKFRERWNASSELPGELRAVLDKNRMSARDPLSAESFRSWRDSVSERQESVMTDPRSGVVTLREATSDARNGQIVEARLVVRSGDWHPVAQTLIVKSEPLNQEYQILEMDFSVSAWDGGSAQFFFEPETNAASLKQARPRLPADQMSAAESPIARAEVVDLDQTEMQVRSALHWLGADLGEQLEIGRTVNEIVVRGVVNDAARKAELASAFSGVPHVSMKIISPEEVPLSPPGVAAPAAQDSVTHVTWSPFASLLESQFPDKAEREAFVNQLLQISENGLERAWALRRLAQRYDASAVKALRPESRRQFHVLLKDHLIELRAATVQWKSRFRILIAAAPPEPEPTPK